MKPEFFCFPVNQLLNYALFLTHLPSFPRMRVQIIVEYLPGGRCPGWINLPDFKWELLLWDLRQIVSLFSYSWYGKNNTYFTLQGFFESQLKKCSWKPFERGEVLSKWVGRSIPIMAVGDLAPWGFSQPMEPSDLGASSLLIKEVKWYLQLWFISPD